MRIAYLVLAHHKPEQLARLVQRLDTGDSSVIVHVDATAELSDFERAVDEVSASATFATDREDIRWGGFGLVKAELACLREAVANHPADYYILLSGVDYPIRSREQLEQELASGATYMESWPMPDAEHHKPMSRLEYFYFPARNRKRAAARFLNSVVLQKVPKRNVAKGLGGRQPYGGSQWWAFPHDVARGVLDFCDREPGFVRFFSRSRIPDEMFFQTIVAALPGQRELRPPLTFADWSLSRRAATGSRPAILGSADLSLLRSCDGYFARKFDTSADPAVFDLIDAELLAPLAK